MRLRQVALASCLAWLCALACNAEDPGPGEGSNTNWLRPCEVDGECAAGASCICHVCSEPCTESCATLSDGVCAPPGSAKHRALCGAEVTSGICLPACGAAAPCAAGQLCLAGSCVQLASANQAASGCVSGARLELDTGGAEPVARYGTLFGDALYLPVAYEERPEDWTEPTAPLAIAARVTDEAGEPVEGCDVRFLTGDEHGVAFAERGTTDAAGSVEAYWVAGASRQQELTAALVDRSGRVVSEVLAGTAYAHDEGPQSDSAAATMLTRPTTLWLAYELPVAADMVRVHVSGATHPHHAFYAALSIDGFFAGLQNTSDFDALSGELPAENRIVLASVWNLAAGDAELLFRDPEAECGPHDQELGGIQCELYDAWQPGEEYLFTLSRVTLAAGEVGPGYAELAYATTPCASADGCTDYTLFYGTPGDANDAMRRVVAYRYQAAARATQFRSFVQPYAELEGQTSCLDTPRYDATFVPYVMVDDAFERVASAELSATYLSWHNEICANYAAHAERSGFRLATGGSSISRRPALPDEPARSLSVP